MRLAIRLCAGALLSCALPASAQMSVPVDPVYTLTEAQAIDRLMAQDPGVRAIRTRVDEVRAAWVDRARWPNPSVTLNRESVADTSDVIIFGLASSTILNMLVVPASYYALHQRADRGAVASLTVDET